MAEAMDVMRAFDAASTAKGEGETNDARTNAEPNREAFQSCYSKIGVRIERPLE